VENSKQKFEDETDIYFYLLYIYFKKTFKLFYSTGMTPLMMAALKGNCVVIDILLEHKADVNQRNILGQSALDIAAAVGHEQLMQLLQSDNCDHTELKTALPDLVTGIAIQKTGETETYMSTEKNEAYTQISAMKLEEKASQLHYMTPQYTTKIFQNLDQSDSLSPSFQFTEPWAKSSTDTNIVPISAASSSFSLQNPDMMSATYTPKIEYCTACSSHHLSNSLHCLKNKSSNISKLDVPVPMHNMCISGSVITKLQNQTDKPSEHVIQPFIPRTNNTTIPSRICTFILPGSVLSPQDNIQIGQSTTQAYNLRVKTVSPQSNHNICSPSIETTDISMENNYKLVDIPQSLLQPHVSTEDIHFQEARYRDLSPQTNTQVCCTTTHDNFPSRAKNTESHSLAITALSPQTNIQIYRGTTHAYNLPSRGLSPRSNTKPYTLADRAHSPQTNAQICHGTTHAYNISSKGLSPVRNTEAYSLSDAAHSPQTNAQFCHGTTQAYNIPSKRLSPRSNTEAYSLADRAHSPQTNAQICHGTTQAYNISSKELSPLRNTEAYSLADRAHFPQTNAQICHGTTHAYDIQSKGLVSPKKHRGLQFSKQSTFSSN
jgi:hypothetical protein